MDKPLDLDPGTKYQYSNTSYLLLGKIIDKAAGLPWEEFLRREIFMPAGMMETRADANTEVIAKRADGYRGNGGKPVNAAYIDMRIPGAAGALLSTLGDLYKWDRALEEGKVLSAASMAKMWSPEKNEYGYGWIVKMQDGKKFQGHSGGIDGFSSQIARLPEVGILVVVLSNFEDGQTDSLQRDLI